MLKVGIAGMGFMGWIHWLAYQRIEDVEVVAIWEMDPVKRSGDWTGIKGNFGPAGQKVDLSDIATYDSLDDFLNHPELDVVDICLPPALHHSVAIDALNAGKNVFSEKPMSLWLEQCDLMMAAAKSNSKMLMVGHVLPFFPEYAYARQVIDSGEHGELIGGRFLRVISDPKWLTGFYDPKKIGGPMLDLHVHDAHLIRMLFGKPTEVQCCGRTQGEVAKYWNTIFRFEDPRYCVSATSGVIDQPGRSFTHGFEIHLESATLHFELAVVDGKVESMPLKMMTSDGKVVHPELPAGDDIAGFEAELREMKRSIESGHASDILGGQLARDAIELCQQQSEAIFATQKV